MKGFRTSINGVYSGGQIQEVAAINIKHQMALDTENYPHKDGVHDVPKRSCLKRGVTNCRYCWNEAYPPCLEVAVGKPRYGSL